MELSKDSYVILHKQYYDDFIETITIRKEELTAWRDHYDEVINNIERFPITPAERSMYIGKVEVLNDLLKYFDAK